MLIPFNSGYGYFQNGTIICCVGGCQQGKGFTDIDTKNDDEVKNNISIVKKYDHVLKNMYKNQNHTFLITSNYEQPILNNIYIIYDTQSQIKINIVVLHLIIKICYQ